MGRPKSILRTPRSRNTLILTKSCNRLPLIHEAHPCATPSATFDYPAEHWKVAYHKWSPVQRQETHGNLDSDMANGDSPPMTRDGTVKMSKPNLDNFAFNVPASPRPPLTTQQSNSLPSTPYQHARKLSDECRIPSPAKGIELSPSRSAHSESDSTLRPPGNSTFLTGCKYETGMAYSRRRIPYSIGGDKLQRASMIPKKFLEPKTEEKLSGEMQELYGQLLPSQESEERRARFVQKLDALLNNQWPGNDIKVHVFGSSGNMLFTSDSDGQQTQTRK